MAVEVQSFPKKNFGQSSVHPMHQSVNYPMWWNSHEQQFLQSLSNNLSLKVGSPPQVYQEGKHVGLQPQHQDSSSSPSSGQSHQEATATGGANSQDQCISSDSDENCRKRVEGQTKPLLVMANPNLGVSAPQVDISTSVTHIPYPYGDPYCNGLFAGYGPQAIIQPGMVGIAPTRVPLPLDLAEDGPIYVNAKQYHGILRRRQIRAKLEAQNKLVKNRKPYLHESRHLHALNRVRGSGGRFLSAKKSRQLDPTLPASSHCAPSAHFYQNGSDLEVHKVGAGKHEASTISDSGTTHAINSSDAIFQQPHYRFSHISPRMGVSMQGSRGLLGNGTQHRTPVVR
ncbi:hypothetical protein RJ640_012987 [Escallonia rubra]|uniref:Nuclear transcription factor Y subunit n=1 Tax=Escallonia rubra TaxID=112253 RepID=A0AA88RC10_9ASTE|nr:hypothetical protein RJ640_012987 [Escallonia rubra]